MSLLVLSGPSGSGKSTLCSAIFEEFSNIYFSISSTTRSPRSGEQNGREYFFLTQEEFLSDIKQGYFLEWAQVYGHYYGTSIKPVERALQDGKLVIFDVDVQGHRDIKKHYGSLATSVFITTPTKGILSQRLQDRQTDEDEVIKTRLQYAYSEMKHMGEFDYIIINDNIHKAKTAILSIVRSLNYIQRSYDVQKILKEWSEN